MAPASSRRSTSMLPAVAIGAATWAASSFFFGGPAPRAFNARAAAPTTVAPKPVVTSRVTMRNFKEDFESWRSSLSPEERELLQEQAMGEFNKAYRKSENFKKDLPDEKVKAFGQILSKFFENESEDYKKASSARVPDYDGLLKVAGDKYTVDFSLKNRIVEIDRQADRRYDFASRKIWDAEQKGEKFPQSSPCIEKWAVRNNDTDSHDAALEMMKFVKMAGDDPNCPADKKAAIAKVLEMGVPPVGTLFELPVQEFLVQQILTLRCFIVKGLETYAEDHTDEEVTKFAKEETPAMYAEVARWMQEKYFDTQELVQAGADFTRDFFRSQEARKDELKGKTKADIMKEIWAELPKVTGKPVPPLDDEMLAELAEEPAIADGEFMHSWGTADKLYKSEAIDSFGEEFLLGVYETKDEAQKAFAEWNKAYEEARETRAGEIDQWTKQEMARLEREKGPGTERIKEMLEEARGR